MGSERKEVKLMGSERKEVKLMGSELNSITISYRRDCHNDWRTERDLALVKGLYEALAKIQDDPQFAPLGIMVN